MFLTLKKKRIIFWHNTVRTLFIEHKQKMKLNKKNNSAKPNKCYLFIDLQKNNSQTILFVI